MSAGIKAIVFKTSQLKETEDFFKNILKLTVKESSAQHFVIGSKGLRLLFIESQNNFEVEMYINEKQPGVFKNLETAIENSDIKSYKDPNGITIVITNESIYH